MEENKKDLIKEEKEVLEEELETLKDEVSNESSKIKDNRFIAVSIISAAVLVAAAIIFAVLYKPSNNNGAQQSQTANTTSSDVMNVQPTDAVLGNANAPVTIIEYGDYQCPYCNMFSVETLPLIVKNYVDTGKVKMIFRDFIVNDRTASDTESLNSALAAACANDQGKFWNFHDALTQLEFTDETKNPQTSENNGNLSRDAFMNIVSQLGMDSNKFASCYNSQKYLKQVQDTSASAMNMGLNATPTFFINGQQVVGAVPYSQFSSGIDSLLNQKK